MRRSRLPRSASFAEPGKGAEVELTGMSSSVRRRTRSSSTCLLKVALSDSMSNLSAAEGDVQAIDRTSLVGEDLRVAPGAEEDAEEQDCNDEGGIEEESEGATPEGSEFDAVELLQPLGLACGEVAHADECTGLVCYAGFVP